VDCHAGIAKPAADTQALPRWSLDGGLWFNYLLLGAEPTHVIRRYARVPVVALAQEHGFTHGAVDLADVHSKGERSGAVVSGD